MKTKKVKVCVVTRRGNISYGYIEGEYNTENKVLGVFPDEHEAEDWAGPLRRGRPRGTHLPFPAPKEEVEKEIKSMKKYIEVTEYVSDQIINWREDLIEELAARKTKPAPPKKPTKRT